MKTLAVVALALTASGCMDSAGDVSDESDVDAKAPVAVVAGNQLGQASSQGSSDSSQATTQDDATSTSDGDAASTFEDVAAQHCDNHNRMANNVPVRDASGVFTTVSARGYVDLNNEFFQDPGTNGRRCVSCHVPPNVWTIH